MKCYQIMLKPQAVKDLDAVRKYDAAKIVDGIETHLSYNPDQDSDFRLRVDDYRIFYNIDESEKVINVLRILHKSETVQFYRKEN